MDAKLMLRAFFTLFLVEMGDRTQFAALALAASSRKPWSVFAGALAGLALALLLAVVLADVAGRYLPEVVLRKSAAVLCIAMGVWMWWR
jgi:putative Ca2+/H+ antiporter (TMEM165/GDT1 family)